MPVIRTICETDSIDELTELLHRAYARLGDMGLNYTAVNQTPEVTRDRIRNATCFVAVDGSKLVGTIAVHHTSTDTSEAYYATPGVAAAHQFAVDPALQGEGIGRLLLQRAEQWAVQHGYRELAIDTAEQATHLIELYTRLGYRHVGHVQWSGKVYRSVILSKALNAAPSSRINP
ncbi:MAG: GNAT family N-acetyltransferase [Planctomycetes bacterium]|nr:GNAT family N-acetyltransferase [Planctomycetota bacterium]